MNLSKMERGVREFLDGLELSSKDDRFPGDELERTPRRVARAWHEDLLSGYSIDPRHELTWIDAPRDSGPVLVRGVRFASVCVHHLLPFFGAAHVAYLPDRRLAGLSKIGRVVDAFARRLQTQERLTSQVVETLSEGLEARGVLVVLEAAHTCMTLRGVRKEQSRMTTLGTAGVYDTDAQSRAEVLALLRAGSGG
jgi:GTP cyclohydrolase I